MTIYVIIYSYKYAVNQFIKLIKQYLYSQNQRNLCVIFLFYWLRIILLLHKHTLRSPSRLDIKIYILLKKKTGINNKNNTDIYMIYIYMLVTISMEC